MNINRFVCKTKNSITKHLKKYLINKHNLFDEDYYVAQYPDVLNSKKKPLKHFILYGYYENRSAKFNQNKKKLDYIFNIHNLSFFKIVKIIFYSKLKLQRKSQINYSIPCSNKKNQIDNSVPSSNKKNEIDNSVPSLNTKKQIDYLKFKEERFGIKSFKVRYAKDKPKEILLFFNGFNLSSFFGGKATVMKICIFIANKRNYNIKIIDQTPQSIDLKYLSKILNIDITTKVEILNYNDIIEFTEKDIIICSMWNNANKVLNTPAFENNKIFYILQEVETFFYDHGDDHLVCSKTLSDKRLNIIVNSKLLHDSLIQSGKYPNIEQNSIYFEPAFEKKSIPTFNKKEKYNFFFYARPSHQRNIYYFGMDVLLEAFQRNLFDLSEWNFYIAGDNSQVFSNIGLNKFQNLEIMSWSEYEKFIATIDLAYSMIYTPHPSYPPLDTANSGGICLTNKYENKSCLGMYSKNIICADLEIESMVNKLAEAIALVKNTEKRKSNYIDNAILNNWDDSFEKIYNYISKIVD